ncbi:hypothetical protein J6590_030440 [Homalodisca vitripennis]|nr:hypothetical protein J6590_030440 [Homalodisca vitripennis]
MDSTRRGWTCSSICGHLVSGCRRHRHRSTRETTLTLFVSSRIPKQTPGDCIDFAYGQKRRERGYSSENGGRARYFDVVWSRVSSETVGSINYRQDRGTLRYSAVRGAV